MNRRFLTALSATAGAALFLASASASAQGAGLDYEALKKASQQGSGNIKIDQENGTVDLSAFGSPDDPSVTIAKNKQKMKKRHGKHSAEDLEKHDPVECSGAMVIKLTGVFIKADTPIKGEGNCMIKLVNSVIESSGTAVTLSGNAMVTLDGTVLKGKNAYHLTGNSVVSARDSHFKGKRVAKGNAVFTDKDGNTFE